jgi:PAS domain S-box-containing protein
MQNLSYRYKLSILVAIIFPCLSRLVLQGSGVEYELSRYAAQLGIGGSIGYMIGYLFDNSQKALQLSKQTNLNLGKKVKEQRVRETWYTALFEKNHSILILINSTTGLIEEANPSACEFYGYTLKQFQKMHISEINVLAKENLTYEIARAKAEKKQNLFLKHKLASGEERDVEVFSGSIVIDGTSFLFSVVSDITEQKALRGIVPICAHCKQIRDGEGGWNQIEEYIQHHSEATFTHGICPSCAQQHYPICYELQQN